MKPNKTADTPDIEEDSLEPISKTKLKAAMEELQDLGVTLVGLSKDKLAKLNLPENLLDAINEAKRITSNGATRRQMQYIGKLMREVDTAPIVEQLQRWDGKHTAENAYFHQLERWRERLLADEKVVSEFIGQYPHADIQQLRTLIRNAKREQAANKPPKSSRELFKLLREITSSGQADEDESLDAED